MRNSDLHPNFRALLNSMTPDVPEEPVKPGYCPECGLALDEEGECPACGFDEDLYKDEEPNEH